MREKQDWQRGQGLRWDDDMKGEGWRELVEGWRETSVCASVPALGSSGNSAEAVTSAELTSSIGSEAVETLRGEQGRPLRIATTSWDDGHPFDLRVAELLAKYGLTGTFYVPITNYLPVMKAADIRRLHGLGMEIGSHGVTHSPLVGLPAARRELVESKARLEELLGTEVHSFCYPKGKFDRSLLPLVKEAGYRLARTTVSFRVGVKFNPWLMPTSFQFYPHVRRTHIKHALRGANLSGLAAWVRFFGMECELLTLSDRIVEHIASQGGIFHIWGHSWEIDACGLWSPLEKVLERIANQPDFSYLANSEVVKQVGGCAS